MTGQGREVTNPPSLCDLRRVAARGPQASRARGAPPQQAGPSNSRRQRCARLKGAARERALKPANECSGRRPRRSPAQRATGTREARTGGAHPRRAAEPPISKQRCASTAAGAPAGSAWHKGAAGRAPEIKVITQCARHVQKGRSKLHIEEVHAHWEAFLCAIWDVPFAHAWSRRKACVEPN